MNSKVNYFTNIDISVLPKSVQQELYDFYIFLRDKYSKKKANKEFKNVRKDIFLKSIKKHKFYLPKDYEFNRELANER